MNVNFLKRNADADTLDSDDPAWRVGISMAATWSWGASAAVAIAVMHNKGLIPYLAWMAANMVAIPIFGVAYYFIPDLRKWKNLLPMLALWAFIGFFAIVMNLSVLKAALGGGVDINSGIGMSSMQATVVVIAVGLLIAAYIHKTGLRGSVFTDVGQLTLQFAGVTGIVVAGFATGARADIPMMVGDQQSWMISAVLGLLSGCIASGMQWQRIEAVKGDWKKLKSTLWGGSIFTVFLLIVTVAGFLYDGSLAVSIPFLLTILAISTSTSDSGSALLQYVGQRFALPASAGSIVTVCAVLVFPFVSQWGITGIWTFYATTRWKVVAGLLLLTLIYNAIDGVPKKVHDIARSVMMTISESNDPMK